MPVWYSEASFHQYNNYSEFHPHQAGTVYQIQHLTPLYREQFIVLSFCLMVKVKVPRNRLESSERGLEVYLYTLLISALERGVWPAPSPGSFTLGKGPVPFVQETGWAPGSVWTYAKNLAPYRGSIPGPSSR
jgi:hypothetical protein